MAARVVYVLKDDFAALFASVVNDDVAVAHDALRYGSLNDYVLNRAQRNVARGARK